MRILNKEILRTLALTTTAAAMMVTPSCTKSPEKPDVQYVAKKKNPNASAKEESYENGARNEESEERSSETEEKNANSQRGIDYNQQGGGSDTNNGTDNNQSNNNGTDNNQSNNNNTDTENAKSYKDYGKEATQADIDRWVAEDRIKRGSEAGNFRYAYIPASFMKDKKHANYARVGFAKALNSVAIAADDIYNPEDASDGHGIVFAFDITKYWGNRATQKWNIVAGARTKRIFAAAPNLDMRSFDANKAVSADRLTYNLLHGGIYNQLIDTEGRGTIQKRKLQAGNVTHTMAIKNAITIGPRFSQRRQMPNGKAYWESFDQFFGRRGMEVPYISSNRLPRFRGDGMLADFGVVASESWNHMENGMIAYYIWGNANQERTKAEQAFVIDPLNHKGGDLLNGFCVFCHISGVQAAPSDVPQAIKDGRVQGQHAERLKNYFSSAEDLADIYAKDRKIFTDALGKIVDGMSDGDKVFNEGLKTGADTREPAYFLVSRLTGSNLDGVVRGNDTREALANRRRGGGGQGFNNGGGGGGW